MIALADPERDVQDYIDGVIAGDVVVGRLVRLCVDRHLLDLKEAGKRGWVFDRDIATRAVLFFPMCCRHSIGEWDKEPFELAPWQKFIIWVLFGWRNKETGYRRFRKAYLSVSRKNGKGLALDTPLPTPTGWTTMGDVQPGDTLLDDNGLPCKVTFVSDIKTIDCYEMQFSNGERVTCDGDHLWVTKARIQRPGKGHDNTPCPEVQVRDVRTIRDTLTAGSRGDRNHSIAMQQPLQLPAVKLPIDPYVLGAWLGDGHTDTAAITCSIDDAAILQHIVDGGVAVKLRTKDKRSSAATFGLSNPTALCRRGHGEEYQNKKGRCLACDRAIDKHKRNGEPLPPIVNVTFQEQLRNLGVLGNKHIPAEYLRASYSQRLSLLQGLMDTDGHISKSGRVLEFSTTREAIREGISELLASLGIKFSVKAVPMRCNRRNVEGTAYRIQFMAFRDQIPAFRLPRKLDRMRLSGGGMSPRSRTVQICSVTPVPSVPTKCIQVDSPSRMFLCGRTMLPTHNTTWAAALGLLTMFADEPFEPGAEIYCAATKEDQAKILHKEAVRMVAASPALSKRATLRSSPQRVIWEKQNSLFRPLGSDKPFDGLNPHCIVLDELHAWREHHRPFHETMNTGSGARRQPLMIIITTAGDDKSQLWIEEDDFAVKVLESVISGHIIDDTAFAFVCRIDEGDDPFDEAVWPKANPNYGVSVKPEYLRIQANEALHKPTTTNQFLRYHCNIRVGSTERAISAEMWRKGDKPLTVTPGTRGFAGLDIGRSNDWCAVGMCFPFYREKESDEDDGIHHWEIMAKAWTAKDGSFPVASEPYRTWIKNGWLECSAGDQVDFSDVRRTIADWSSKYELANWAFDPNFATSDAQFIQEECGVELYKFWQSARMYNEPVRRFLRELHAGRIWHGNEPVLSWQAGNLTIRRNSRDEWMPEKGQSLHKIDGMIAVLMAFAGCIAQTDTRPTGSLFIY